MKRLLVVCVALCAGFSACAWGIGHETTVRAILKRLPAEVSLRMKPEWIPLWEEASHLPDNVRHDILTQPDRGILEKAGWKGMSLHEDSFRFKMFDLLVEDIRRGDDYSAFMMIAALSHVIADSAACNHNPIVQCSECIWGKQGLNLMSGIDCDFSVVEKTPAMRAVFDRRIAAVPVPVLPDKMGSEHCTIGLWLHAAESAIT